MSNTYLYTVDDNDYFHRLTTEFSHYRDPRLLAEDAARDYHSNQDGWEGDWPIKVAIYKDITQDAVYRAEVSVEWDPVFHATELLED